MLLTCYLVSGVLFYYFAAKSAPVLEEPSFDYVVQPTKVEVIELFGERADRPASRAA